MSNILADYEVVMTAQRMVSRQTNCTLARALALLENTAEAAEVSVCEVAEHVVNREVRFDTPN